MSLILRRFLPSFTRSEPKISNYLVKNLVIGNVRFHSNDEINSKTPPPPPSTDSANKNRPISPRMEEFQEKLRAKTPIGRLGWFQLRKEKKNKHSNLFLSLIRMIRRSIGRKASIPRKRAT